MSLKLHWLIFHTCKFHNLGILYASPKVFPEILKDLHTKLLLLDTALLCGHHHSLLCPTALLGASPASVYTGHLSNIVNLPSPLCLLSLLPLHLWSQQKHLRLSQGASPDDCAHRRKVAWWSVGKDSPGQHSLWEFPQTWCFCVPVTEPLLSLFLSFLLFPSLFPLPHLSILFLVYTPSALWKIKTSTEAVLEVSVKWWTSYCIQNSFSFSN